MPQVIVTDAHPRYGTYPRQASAVVYYNGKTHIAYEDGSRGTSGGIIKVVTLDHATSTIIGPFIVDTEPVYDDHGYPSIAVDSRGYLHIVYDGHQRSGKYRKSLNPNDASRWSNFSYIGIRMTYPMILIDKDDIIYLAYREEGTGGEVRQLRLIRKHIDAATWTGPFIAVTVTNTNLGCPYPGRLALGKETSGQVSLHLTWNWFWYQVPGQSGAHGTATDCMYAVSTDGGQTWKKANGTPYTTSIDENTADYVYKGQVSPPDTVHSYHTEVVVDHNGVAHIFYCITDGAWHVVNFYHAYWTGSWTTITVGPFFFGKVSCDLANVLWGRAMRFVNTAPYYEVSWIKSTDGGATWTSGPITSGSAGGNFYPYVSHNLKNNSIQAVWHERHDELSPQRSYLLYDEWSATPIEQRTLTITATTGGVTDPPAGQYNYAVGTVVTVKAIPDPNYSLDHWELDGAVYSNNIQVAITMDANHILHAVFISGIQEFTLNVDSTPLTGVEFLLSATPHVTPYSATLPQGNYIIVMPTSINVAGQVYVFKQWEDASINPTRTIALNGEVSVLATYELYTPPPDKGTLDIHAFVGSLEIVASGTIVEANLPFTTPAMVDLDVGTYTVQATYQEQTKTQTANVVTGQVTRVDLLFPSPRPCFIATVAYGSNLAPQLSVLRRFRDKCLPDTLVAVYYRVGAHLASWIKGRSAAKHYVREVLNLLVRLLKKGVLK